MDQIPPIQLSGVMNDSGTSSFYFGKLDNRTRKCPHDLQVSLTVQIDFVEYLAWLRVCPPYFGIRGPLFLMTGFIREKYADSDSRGRIRE